MESGVEKLYNEYLYFRLFSDLTLDRFETKSSLSKFKPKHKMLLLRYYFL